MNNFWVLDSTQCQEKMPPEKSPVWGVSGGVRVKLGIGLGLGSGGFFSGGIFY